MVHVGHKREPNNYRDFKARYLSLSLSAFDPFP